MSDITTITINTYYEDPEHRRLADRLLDANGLDPLVVRTLVRQSDGTWTADCLKRNEADNFYVDPATLELACEWVALPNQVQP